MSSGPDVPARVIVVDDDRLIREMVRDAIGTRARVECCDSSEAALDALHREPADLIVSDLTMPGLSGIELLEEVRRTHPATDFMLLTGNATLESAVGALRMGAADYLTKPINGDELALVVERILAQRRLIEENEKLRENLITVESCRNLIRCLEPAEIYTNALDLLLQHLPRQRGLALFHRRSIPTDGMLLVAQVVIHRVHHDAVEPVGEGFAVAKLADIAEQLQECLLGDILGVLTAEPHLPGDGQGARFVAHQQAIEGLPIALLGAADQSVEGARLGLLR